MNADALSELAAADLEYAQLWCDSTARVLESLHSVPFTGTCHPSKANELAANDDGLAILFKISGCIEGEQAFQIAKPDAVRLAQLLMSEPMDASVAFADTHTDALHEIFRQFAGLAATACKTKYGSEVQFQLETGTAPEWKDAVHAVAIFAAPQVNPIQWTLSISHELHAVLAVLEAAREARSPAPVAPPRTTPAASKASAQQPASGAPPVKAPAMPPQQSPSVPTSSPVSASTPANLNLLLDIELDASLRFGRREMMLRDILDLRPGSVVELDRQIQEPAELLVAGRVIARGDVVIVDGSYGLRITEIEQPQQRLLSVETG